ncbi:uncharacterized protein C2orf78 homolog [Arvicola amphibius]|uniref:uncharacterized protein C2orf78 homolog n=1 Tax=Arvicola amphibius TaxID=1047088 RepID=UPI0018E3B1EE|nr:uncharacterized protein C2orf78 homolog [Arvicola amphibius]
MSENCQSTPFAGTECALQPSVPVLRNATPSAGSVYNFYGVSTPAVSSVWLLPSGSSTCCQQLSDGANLYQRAGMTMLTELTDQNQISASTFSYPGVLHWDLRESTTRREAPFLDTPVTIIDQNTIPASWSMTAQCDNIFQINALPLCFPTLSACLVQAPPSNEPDQRYILAPCYQDGSQVYYYDQNSLGPPMAEEFWQCQQAYGSVSCSDNQASSLHPEMVMALQDIQPMNVQTPYSTSAIYWPTSAQTTPDTSLQVVERETNLGLTPSGQTLCPLQSPDLGNACTQDAQMMTAPVNGDRSLIPLMHSPSEFLALPPAPSLEKTQKNNAAEMNAEPSTPLDSYEGTKSKQDAIPLFLAPPGTQQPLNYRDAGSLRQKLASHNATLGNSSLGLEEPEALRSVMESSNDFADMTALVADVHLPQLFNFITGLDQMEDHTASQTKDSTDIRRDQAQSRASTFIGLSEPGFNKDQKVSDVLHGTPQAKTQQDDILKEDDPGNIEGTIDNMANNEDGKSQIFVPKRPRVAWAQGKDKAKETRENNSKKTEELKPSRCRVKAEGKPAIPKTKRKRNPPELSHDKVKKPRTQLGMHMLESVQVFHPLGKKSEKKPCIASSQALLNFSSNKEPRTGPTTTSLGVVPREGRGPDKSLGNAQRTESSAHKECPSPSQDELPPHGKVKLVPLPFLALDKPQARPVSRKLHCLAPHRPTTAYPVRPHSSRQPTLKPSQPAPARTSSMASDKSTLSIATSTTRPNVSKAIQSCTGPQPPASSPAPYRASSHTSLHREPLSSTTNKTLDPPQPQSQYLRQDFSHLPIPWRKVDIPGPVISQPIPEEQRPEREAMKRRAQQERENAAKCTSLGKPQLFLQREKDMEISRYYGYAV